MNVKEINLKDIIGVDWFSKKELYEDGRVWYFSGDKE